MVIGREKGGGSVPQRYVPYYLKKGEKEEVKNELKKSRRLYKEGKYYTRKRVKGARDRKTSWRRRVVEEHSIPDDVPLNPGTLSKYTKCSPSALRKIERKGMGAYFSSGSRPNQTPKSWGRARLFSSLSGGPASEVDRKILEEGCPPNSKVVQIIGNRGKKSNVKKVNL